MNVNAMNFKEIVDKRRAINFFDPDRDLPEALLDQVIELAAKTPSSFNLQPWNLMVLRDAAAKQRLREKAWNQPKITEAPVVLIVLGDRDGWKQGHPTVEENWRQMLAAGSMAPEQREWFLNAAASLYGRSAEASLAFGAKNAGFFAMSLMYAAASLGLDTHPMDGFDHEGVKKAFNIPDNFWVPLLMAVGYLKPGVTVAPPKWRKTKGDIVVSFD
jgi:nitroreductase